MKLWTRSCIAGIRRVSRRQLRELQDYLGAELGFYFSCAPSTRATPTPTPTSTPSPTPNPNPNLRLTRSAPLPPTPPPPLTYASPEPSPCPQSSWTSFYTRYLWAPAALGLVTYIAQAQLEMRIEDDARLASNASSTEAGQELGSGVSGSGRVIGDLLGNASAAGDPSAERVARESLTAMYALFMSLWAALFVERWKRRAKLLCLDWDVIGQARARGYPHPDPNQGASGP